MKAVIAIDSNSITITRDEEVLWIKRQLLAECDVEWTFVDVEPWEITKAPKADVYVVDFGGLGVHGDNYRVRDSVRSLLKMIEDHPGRLFMLWSVHTENWYLAEIRRELEAAGAEKIPDNVVLYGSEPAWNKARSWLGVSKPEDPEENEDYQAITAKIERLNNRQEETEADEALAEHQAKTLEEYAQSDQSLEEFAEENRDKIIAHQGQAIFSRGEHLRVGPIKEPIAMIQIPLYCTHRPGQTHGAMNWKLGDCMVNVSEGEGENKKELGTLGGVFYGKYEISYPAEEQPGSSYTYEMRPKDIWAAMEDIHERFKREHQQAQVSTSAADSNGGGGGDQDDPTDVGNDGDAS